MLAGRYAVSIQWGAGYHYFVYSGDDKAAAKFAYDSHKERLTARRAKKGAKPKVHMWEQLCG